MFRKAIVVVFTAVFFTFAAWAGVVPGKWEKVQAENPGSEMIIKLASGEEIRAVYQEVGADSLLVTVDGKPRTLPKQEVRKITAAERRKDRVWDGAVIGAAAGTVVGIVAMSKEEDFGAAIVPLTAGIWAGIGLGLDAAIKTRPTLYLAPGVN